MTDPVVYPTQHQPDIERQQHPTYPTTTPYLTPYVKPERYSILTSLFCCGCCGRSSRGDQFEQWPTWQKWVVVVLPTVCTLLMLGVMIFFIVSVALMYNRYQSWYWDDLWNGGLFFGSTSMGPGGPGGPGGPSMRFGMPI